MPVVVTPRPVYLGGVRPGDDITAPVAGALSAGHPVVLPPGTFDAAGLVLRTGSLIRGSGEGQTILRLKAGSSTDLLVTEGFATYTGGVTRNGPTGFTIQDITLDGNRDNVTSGWPLRIYGCAYNLTNVEIQNGRSGGMWSEWGTGGTDMEAHVVNFRIHDCTGIGLDFQGPHDSMFTNGSVFKNTDTAVYTHGNATSEQFTAIHVWGEELDYGFYFSSPAYCTNCVAEGATVANVTLNCNFGGWEGGSVFGTNTGAETGFLIGDSTTARYWRIRTTMYNWATTGRPLNYNNSNGNDADILLYANSASLVAVHGTPAAKDSIRIFCPDQPSVGAASQNEVVTGYMQFYRDGSTRGLILGNEPNYSFMDILESTGTLSAVANGARIMAVDNGAGKTQLVVRFNTGAAQVIATQP